MLDELVSSARDATRDGWDDIREARVLQRVLDADVAAPASTGRSRLVVAAVAVAAALVLAVWASLRPPLERAEVAATWMTPPPTVPTPPAPAGRDPSGSFLRFSDGSAATLHEGAELEVRRDVPVEVEVAHQGGEVLYAVPAAAPREFRVEARHTSIRAEIAVFNVAVAGDVVEVDVIHGVVTVHERTRAVRLTAGESITIRPGAEEPPVPSPTTSPPRSPTENGPTAAELMARADRARREGDTGGAADALRELLRRYPRDARVPTAAFTLGRVESGRGHHRAAAKAYERAWRRNRGGSLAEDALGRAASAWAQAGQDEQAARVARRYLKRYPTGVHSERMRALVF